MEKGLQTEVHRITLTALKDDTVTVFETVNAIDTFGKYEHSTLPDLLADVGRFVGAGNSSTMATNQNVGSMVYEVLPSTAQIPLIQVSIKTLGPHSLRWAAATMLGLENFKTPDPISDPAIVLSMFREVKGVSITKKNSEGNYVIADFADADLGVAVARAYVASQTPDGITTTRVPLDLFEKDQKEVPEPTPED